MDVSKFLYIIDITKVEWTNGRQIIKINIKILYEI